MKKQNALIILLSTLFFLFVSLNCYAVDETWVYKYSSPDDFVRFNDVISVSSGGYLGVGNVWDAETGDTAQNAVVSRMDQNGQTLWSKNFTFSGRWVDDLSSVVESSDGGFIATGVTLLEGPDIYGNTAVVNAVLILKVDANGNLVWRKVIKNKGNSAAAGNRVKRTNDGNYVIVGGAVEYFRHDTGVYSSVTTAALIIKINTDGEVLFNRAYYGDWTNSYAWSFNDVVQDGDGSYYLTGFASGEPRSEAVGWGGILVAKIGSGGELAWVRKVDSASEGQGIGTNDLGGRILLSGDSLYVTGITGAAFNLSRFSLAGGHSWTKQYSCVRGWDTGISATNDFIHSGDGNFFVLTGGACTAIAKVDPIGNVLWGRTTTTGPQPTSLMLDADLGLIHSSWDSSALHGTHAYVNKYDSNGVGCDNNYDIAFNVAEMEMVSNVVPSVATSLPVSDDEIPGFNGPPLSFEQTCGASPIATPPEPPNVDYEIDGLNVTISWSAMPGATGYKLYYAPYPYAGAATINNLDVGDTNSYSVNLWIGASFYIAVTAYNDAGASGYSNVDYFVLTSLDPELMDDDGDGYTEVDGDCNDADALVKPGGQEICGDGIDQDCSGADLICPQLLTAPVLTHGVSGLDVTISWNEVPGATGYTLYYAPSSSYSGTGSFSSYNVADSTSISFSLWPDSAYHIAVRAYDATSESEYSNIENFVTNTPAPEETDDDGDGYTESQGDCDDVDSNINPGATEICGDGIDQDCSGSDMICPVDSNFTDNGNGTITDSATNLIWQQSDDDQLYEWQPAIDYCGDLTLGGSSNWRLPILEELEGLVDTSMYPRINPLFTGTEAYAYWSSSADLFNLDNAWFVSFGNGVPVNFPKTNSYYVRCVR